MQNFDRRGIEDLNDEARRVGPTGAESFEEPGFLEVHNAFDKYSTNEARSDSEEILMEADVNTALEAYAQVRPDIRDMMEPDMVTPGYMAPSFYKRKELLKALEQDIIRDQAKFPDAGLSTLGSLMQATQEKAKTDRETAMRMFANARGMSKAGIVTGAATGIITDPLILATLPMGAGTISGAGIAGNAFKAFKLEAMIAGVSETAIQPQVYNWKKQINSPYSVQEAALNIVVAMGAAGAIRATGSTIVDVAELRGAAKLKRTEGGKTANSEADILESHADNIEAAGEDIPGHFDAMDQAIDRFEGGRSADTGKTAEHVEAVDPNSVLIDADQFQFKAGADIEGVTERLKGVERWDPKLAGIAIVYENNQSQRFIVDGHQRVSLAKRMIEGGQDPSEVNLNAIVLREGDGVSVADARQIAAVKNIAEGTGSAVDTAKIFRELGETGLDLMPSLPPKSALVAAGRGLANLDDDAFVMVINGVVDERIGGIVGELVQDGAEQKAIISALAQAEPANQVQARIMVNDMKAAGFQKTETMDLFGGQEITESLFKERAKIVEHTLKRLRNDKATFKTLERQASDIADAGNVLKREANLARIATDEETIAQITKSANTKGDISDALSEASRTLKETGNVNQATNDFLGAIRGADAEQRAPGVRAGEPGQPTEAIEFKKGKPVNFDNLDEVGQKAAEIEFKSKQAGRSVEDTYKVATKNQGQLTRAANSIKKELGEDVEYLNPGIKKRADTEAKVERKGYVDAGELTDVVRGGFLVRTQGQGDQVADLLAKKFEVMDESWKVNDAGYFDRKVMVRFKDGTVGEIQIWEPHMLLAKEGEAGLKFIPKKWIDPKQRVLTNTASGHGIYERMRALIKDGRVTDVKAYRALEAESAEVYADAMRSANMDWKTLIETRRPESKISAGEALDQAPGAASDLTKKPEIPSGVSTTTAGRASQLTQDVTDDGVKGVSIPDNIAKGDKEIKAKYTDEPVDPEVAAKEAALDREIYDQDLDIPVGIKTDEDGNIVAHTLSAREVYDDIDGQANALKELEGCLVG